MQHTPYPYPSVSYPKLQNGKRGTFSGARSIFLLNSIPVAFAGGVSFEETIDYEPVDFLSLLEVAEFVPVAYRTTLSAQMFRVVGESVKRNQWFPLLNEILTAGDLEAAIQDVVTGNTVALFTGVKTNSVSSDITARGIVQQSVGFVAIRVQDESENPV
jgi:hypothetical protein